MSGSSRKSAILHSVLAIGESEVKVDREIAKRSLLQRSDLVKLFEDLPQDDPRRLSDTGTEDYIRKCIGAGLLVEAGQPMAKAKPVKLSPALGLAIGVSLGSASLRVGIFDANGDMLYSHVAPYEEGQLEKGPDEVGIRIQKAVEVVLLEAFDDEQLLFSRTGDSSSDEPRVLRLLGMAIAWPGPLDREKTIWEGARRWAPREPVEKKLRRQFLGPIRDHVDVLNDANAAALALAFNYSRERAYNEDLRSDEYEYLMSLRVGGGVGSGLVRVPPHSDFLSAFINTRMIEGTSGIAGEIGHTSAPSETVAKIGRSGKNKPEKRLAPLKPVECGCGAEHHLESYVSWFALRDRLNASDIELPESELFLRSELEQVHGAAIKAQRDLGRILGTAMEPIVLMLNPCSVSLVGSLSTSHVRKGLEEEFGAASASLAKHVEIRIEKDEETNEFIAAKGAALSVIRRQVYRRFEQIAATGPVPRWKLVEHRGDVVQSDKQMLPFEVSRAEVEEPMEKRQQLNANRNR
jgi:predicted NBD/HSP70 family sugar kinase